MVVSGTCGPGLLVKLFNNNQLIGSASCELDGTFRINLSLSVGKNILTALNYDTLDQAGPTSPSVIVLVITPTTPNAATNKPGGPSTTVDKTSPDASSSINQNIDNSQSPELAHASSQEQTYVYVSWILFVVLALLLLVLADYLFNKHRIFSFLAFKRKTTD